MLRDNFLHKCCKDLLNVAFDFHKNAHQMVCRGKTGVGFWVSHNMPWSTARTSAYLCVRGSSRAGGVYYFTWVCSTEQENHCNDEPMEIGHQHLFNHPLLCCWKNFNHWHKGRHRSGMEASINWWCHLHPHPVSVWVEQCSSSHPINHRTWCKTCDLLWS